MDLEPCLAELFLVEGWPTPLASDWVEVRCLCGYISMPMPRSVASRLAQSHELRANGS